MGAEAPPLRPDRWWLPPALTVVALTAFVAYSTWATLVNRDYYARPYLSPFYSPCITSHCGAGGRAATWHLVSWWPFSPAILIVVFPLAFRLTCYYYRKAYYRSFWLSPPACAVPDRHSTYTGESRFPLILQNTHRYFFYLAVPLPVILAWEAVKAFHFPSGWGIGLGSAILVVNAVLLGLYTASCHSCRHLCGGNLRAFSKGPVRYWLWRRVTALNVRHMQLAWVSLGFVALADLYVRLVAAGAFPDPHIVF